MSENRSLLLQVKQKLLEAGADLVGFITNSRSLPLEPVFEGKYLVCVQCHSPISSGSEFCCGYCVLKYWEEFNRIYNCHSGIIILISLWQSNECTFFFNVGKTPLCKFPRCFNSCYVEDNGRIHDYCNRSHAGEHKKMKEAAERQQHTSRNQRGGKGHSLRGGQQLGGGGGGARGGARGGGGAGTSQGGRYQQGM